MKKNLRIVSAAAAALLAVAPIAAAGVSTVSAAADNNITINVPSSTPAIKGDVVLSSHLTATTRPGTTTINNNNGAVTESNWDGKVSGNVTAALNGKDYTLNLNPVLGAHHSVTTLWRLKTVSEANAADLKDGKVDPSNGNNYVQVEKHSNGNYILKPGFQYFVIANHTGFNFGTENANRSNLTLAGNDGIKFGKYDSSKGHWVYNASAKVSTDRNGATKLENYNVLIPVKPVDVTNDKVVSFFEKETGTEVTSGNVTLYAGATQELNVNQVLAAIERKYAAHQFEGGSQYHNADITTSVNDIIDQLKKQNITVDGNDNFVAPKSFTVTLSAKSSVNGATAQLPVTVNVPNGKEVTPATVQSQSKTIMHVAAFYDKNGARTNDNKVVHAYDSVTVAMQTTQINGKAYYEVINNGKATGQYIKASNIDGTSKKLTHNAYVYNTKGHRVKSEGTLKKGTTQTVYGGQLKGTVGKISGKRVYRIAKYRYVKAANF